MKFCPVDGFAVVPVHDPLLGRQLLGHFHLVAVCGRGATGTVYRAVQAAMDRQVAVKVLRTDLLSDPLVVKRFIREARAGARLCHPNIATVHLVSQTEEGIPYIVMEYVEGVPLSSVLESGVPLPPARLLHISEQVASALAEAHDQGIIHRDLKPENILLTEKRGDADIVKVVDFGIAKIVVDTLSGDSQISRLGTIFGTPHYIAPEQASGTEVDARADLYSLGCLMFQMATGKVPFEGTSGIQVLLKHIREEPRDPRTLNPALAGELAQLVLRLLVKDREQRVASAERLLLEIQEVKERLAQGARPGSGEPRLQAEVPGPAPLDPAAPAAQPRDQVVTARHKAASPDLPIDADDPDEAVLAGVRPRWPRRIALLLGGATALGVAAGLLLARVNDGQIAGLSPAGHPLAYEDHSRPASRALIQKMGALVATGSLASAADAPGAATGPSQRTAITAGVAAARFPLRRKALRRPEALASVETDLEEDYLPDVIFPLHGPPYMVAPPERAAPPAPSREGGRGVVLSASARPMPERGSGAPHTAPAAEAAPQPAGAATPVVAPRDNPASDPAQPPAVLPPGEAVPKLLPLPPQGALPQEPAPAQPAPPPEEPQDPNSDPYHMLK